MANIEPILHRSRTKIVATVGPACRDVAILKELVGAGVDVFRLNMAHGSLPEHQQILHDIRALETLGNRPLGVLVDLSGPKMRLGELPHEPLSCPRNAEFHFVRHEPTAGHELTCTYSRLIDELNLGDRVLLADGTVEMLVTNKLDDRIVCRVVGPGTIRSRQGINLPGVKLSVPAMSIDDIEHAKWAIAADVDFISLSFVRSPADIMQLKQIVNSANSRAMVIAKIEKPEAVEQLEGIVGAADGIMVARGDLGVETDVAQMPVVQKRIIDVCRRFKKPVIVATQMLDSMQRSSHPTRAEVTDVANAILDGADACMLSGETAVGNYPIESVEMMNRIMQATEQLLKESEQRRDELTTKLDRVHPITSAVVNGASQIAKQLQASMCVIATRSGLTALEKAKRRDFIPTVAVSNHLITLRQTCLYWGITPLVGVPHDLDQDLLTFIYQWGRENNVLKQGDYVVFVSGTKASTTSHNQLWVCQVE